MWKLWRFGIAVLFVIFFIACFMDGCSFIYHTETSGSILANIELFILSIALCMLLIDVFFDDED